MVPLSQAVLAYDHARHAPLGDVLSPFGFVESRAALAVYPRAPGRARA
jgi:hypothetical protein